MDETAAAVRNEFKCEKSGYIKIDSKQVDPNQAATVNYDYICQKKVEIRRRRDALKPQPTSYIRTNIVIVAEKESWELGTLGADGLEENLKEPRTLETWSVQVVCRE